MENIINQKTSINIETKNIIKLAIPILLGNICYTILGISDTIMSGMASTSDLAGVSIGTSFFFPAFTFIIGLYSALHAIIAHKRGQAKSYTIGYSHKVAFVGILAISFLVTIILLIIPFFLLDINSDQRMAEVCFYYTITIAFCMPLSTYFNSCRTYCEAMNDPKATLIFGVLTVLYNIPLNYIFIFGKFGMPELGGIGCGVATLISMLLTCILFHFYIRFNKRLYKRSMYMCKKKVKYDDVKHFLKQAMPLGIAACVESSCFAIIALLLSPLGPIMVSAHTIALNTTSFLFNMPLSFAVATTILVGFYTGNSDLNSLRNLIKASYRITFISIAISLSFIYIFKDKLPYLWTNDEDVIAYCKILFFFAMANQIFENLQFIQSSIVRGFKDNKIILVVTLIAFYLVSIPVGTALCYKFLGFDLLEGPKGYWVGLLLGLIIASIFYRVRVLHHYKSVKSRIKQIPCTN